MLTNILTKVHKRIESILKKIEVCKLYVIYLLLFGIILIGLFIIASYNRMFDTIYNERATKLKYVADFAIQILDRQNFLVQSHQKTLKQAQNESIEILKRVHFENADYVGIVGDKGLFIYPPYPKFVYNSQREAKIKELSKVAGGGYFKYKVTDVGKYEKHDYSKVSYVEGYKKWNWIIVTGMYLDDIQTLVLNSLFHGIVPVFVVLVILILLFIYIVSTTVVSPAQELTTKSLKLASYDTTVAIPELDYKTEFGNLYRAFNKFAEVFKEKLDNEKKLTLIQDSIADVLITADNTGIITSANPAVEKMFGLSQEEILGKNVDILTSPSLFSGNPNDFEGIKYVNNKYELLGIKNEKFFPIEVDVNEITSKGNELFVLLIRNISSQKEVERMKDEFVYIVGHELKTPLNEIIESLQSKLNDEFSDVEDKVKKLIRESYEEIIGLTGLINDILDVEKLEAGTMEFKIEPTNIFDIVEQIVLLNKPFEDKFKIHYNFINNLPKNTLVNIDKVRFSQVLNHLISNATKFSPENEEVTILTTIKDYSVQISVKDKGPGIPHELQDKIYEKFIRASNLESRQKSGTGLGLHICKLLVEEMEGRISFETEIGKGTTFHIDFPIYLKDSKAKTKINPES